MSHASQDLKMKELYPPKPKTKYVQLTDKQREQLNDYWQGGTNSIGIKLINKEER